MTRTGDVVRADACGCSDRHAVHATVVRYATALDSRQWELLDEVFADDAHAEYGAGTFDGRPAIVAMLRSFLGGCGPSQHLLGNHRIEVDGDRATSRCAVRVLHVGAGERAVLEPFESLGEYVDGLHRTPSGWRIVERRAEWSIRRGDPAVLQAGPER
jgi:hypothetical protein